MGSAEVDNEVEIVVDTLRARMSRGRPLDAAYSELKAFFAEPAQRVVLDRAIEHIRSRIDDLERRRRPTSLHRAGRVAWYDGPTETDRFWPALRTYLLETKRWDQETVDTLDESSSKVIAALDFPGNSRFNNRGLVVGHVQSGKTANFTAVISKAADVNFRVILILSGLTNSLRRQTQERLDRELVALNPTRWQTWTDATSDIGDFPFNIDAMLTSRQPLLAVVKKNGPRLRRLLRMLKRADRTLLEQCPVLIIDDECDQASVNATGDPQRLTAINGILRELLGLLPRVAYIGYTATPYANVLIDPSYDTDLYPRDFIISLPKPAQYFGAERLFGRDLLDADATPPDQEGLDMIRLIDPEEINALRPQGRDQASTFVLSITPSLERAIRYFWLATAAREARGLGHEHSCMLVHTTVYAFSHLNAQPVIEDFVNRLASAIDRGNAQVLKELEELWTEEQARLPAELLRCRTVSFADLRPHLAGVSNRPEVKVENSKSDERLDFSRPTRRYIVIGGNVLARGLTIEGLVVSFFVRAATQYDTLMQMGRWFGYRHGYEDLPRIWMTPEMAQYFKDMATVEAEVRYDIATYDRENLTPLDFAVKIRQHPDLAITAPGKMAQALECDVSFAGQHIQTRKFLADDATWLDANWDAASRLLDRIAGYRTADSATAGELFDTVSFDEIIRFLGEYRAHPAHEQFAGGRLVEYIKRQNTAESGSLSHWNVAVIQAADGVESERALGPCGRVHTVNRSKLSISTDADIKALMSRTDALIDIPVSARPPDNADWDVIKDARIAHYSTGRPLLLLYPIYRASVPRTKSRVRVPLAAKRDVLGLGIIFPPSEHPVVLGYRRAPIDITRFEQAEYVEELLLDDGP